MAENYLWNLTKILLNKHINTYVFIWLVSQSKGDFYWQTDDIHLSKIWTFEEIVL